MTAFRVAGYGRVDHGEPVAFIFDGRSYAGVAGDTLASALLANGVHLVGRSLKYHRPRGVLSSGSDEPNALVRIDRGNGRSEPNTRATVQEIFDGLRAESQNRWPSLRFDLGAVADRVHALLPAGFYYKTFMWPQPFWRLLYEPLIRRVAGLGRAPDTADPETYSARYAHCDVLIVGGGPAGIAAALEAARASARTILVDEQSEIGGGFLAEPSAVIDGKPAWAWLLAALDELRASANVRVLTRTTAIGAYHQNFVALAERLADHLADPPRDLPRERLWRVRARHVVLAQGASEQPLVFDGNDRPGIMLAGAARTYLNRYGVAVGRRVVVCTSDDSAYRAAFDLRSAGVEVAAIVDLRTSVAAAIVERTGRLGIEILMGATIIGTSGRLRVRSVDVRSGLSETSRRIACDTILICGCWTPNVHLFSHGRGTLAWREDIGAFVPAASSERVMSAGAGNGTFSLAGALAEGAKAGALAAGTKTAAVYRVVDEEVVAGADATGPRPRVPGGGGRAFVDFQNDVTAKDIRLAVHEGFRSIEHVKRYTTAGMATDQGKTSNINALTIAADALGKPLPSLGLTTFRPPFTPTTFGTLAGHERGALFAPVRKTPTHDWAMEGGAVFEPVGQWRRARYFPRPGEDMRAAVARECRATRSSLGICDASTLGKIAVIGPDATEFLNRRYVNSWDTLAPGRCRYGLLLGEDGFIVDDGIVGRLSETEFHVTTTSGGAARVLASMEDYLQTEWPDLRVWLTSTTEEWAVFALNGPNARHALSKVVEDVDLSPETLPHMSVRTGHICGVPARLFRASFTGELGFEVNVPSGDGPEIWQALIAAGEEFGICAYGTEAMHVLRAEKGYIIPGQDTDGTVTPDDAGLSWTIGKAKRDFVGMRSLVRPAMLSPKRKQLVGLLTEDPNVVLDEGAQVVDGADRRAAMTSIGHVTSSYRSATLGRSIALALVEGGRRRTSSAISVSQEGQVHRATVSGAIFYDPEGKRLHA